MYHHFVFLKQRPDGLSLDGLDHTGASPLHVSPLTAAHIHSSPQMTQISPPTPIYISTEVSILDSKGLGRFRCFILFSKYRPCWIFSRDALVSSSCCTEQPAAPSQLQDGTSPDSTGQLRPHRLILTLIRHIAIQVYSIRLSPPSPHKFPSQLHRLPTQASCWTSCKSTSCSFEWLSTV